MPLPTDKKAERLISDLYNNLQLRGIQFLSLLNSQEIAIYASNPAVADEANILVRIQAITNDIASVDAFGLSARVYNPQQAQILCEQDSGTPGQIQMGTTYALRLAWFEKQQVLSYELARDGLNVQLWLAPLGLITDASWATATLVEDVGNLLYPRLGEV